MSSLAAGLAVEPVEQMHPATQPILAIVACLALGAVSCAPQLPQSVSAHKLPPLAGQPRALRHWAASGSSPQAVPRLIPGVPQTGNAPGSQFVYYVAAVDTGSTNASLVVALVVTSGDADLYVNLGAVQNLPTQTNFDFASRMYGDDTVVVPSTNPLYCTPCLLTIGVLGFTPATMFSILYTTSDSVQSLVSGQPASGWVDAQQYSYFSLAVASPGATITFSLTAASSSASMVVLSSTGPVQVLPSISNFYWASSTNVAVTPTEPHYLNPGLYTIGVFGGSVATKFTLTGGVTTNPVVIPE